MTSQLASAATTKLLSLANGSDGFNASLALVGGVPAAPGQIRAQNAAAELSEKAAVVKYPAVHIYCQKIVNRLWEKFRTFSGSAHMAIEIRYSQDRLEGLEAALEAYVDAAVHMLHAHRGDWGDGMFYGGEYEVAFGPVRHGGKNFLQVATVTLAVGISK
jgi:hypothetical protein